MKKANLPIQTKRILQQVDTESGMFTLYKDGTYKFSDSTPQSEGESMNELREKIGKILGYKEPLLCDGKHSRGQCDLERIQNILSLFKAYVQSKQIKETPEKRLKENSEEEPYYNAGYMDGVSDFTDQLMKGIE